MSTIPSSRARIMLVPLDGSTPLPLSLVEDCRFNSRYTPEIHHELGKGPGVDGSLNTEQGQVSWGKVHTDNQTELLAIKPQISKWTSFPKVNLMAVDPQTGRPLAYAVGVMPESIDLTFQNGRACRENFSGPCMFVAVGDEITEGAVP